VHFVGLFLSSLLKMHGPKNKICSTYYSKNYETWVAVSSFE